MDAKERSNNRDEQEKIKEEKRREPVNKLMQRKEGATEMIKRR